MKMSFSTLDIAVFFAFLLAVVLLGLYKSRGERGSEGYFLAGRGLSWWLIGISLIAANISTEQFVGMSGNAAGPVGLAIASYEWMAAITLVFVAFFFLPKFLKSGMYTVPQFLEYRFNIWARTIMSMLMVIVLVCVNITAVIFSGATVADTVFEGNSIMGIQLSVPFFCWAIGIIASIYVCAGGLKACAWADLLQGTALIAGGAIITYFAFDALGAMDIHSISTTKSFSPEQLDAMKNSGVMEKFFTLNSDKLTMFRPADDSIIPWTALVIGLWIPNFYYWGFNQYIIQRTLGASSLGEGQKGIMFAAGLKLIIPFIIVIPGIIAFNLFAADQRAEALRDASILKSNAKNYSFVHIADLEAAGKPVSAKALVDFYTVPKGKNSPEMKVLSEAEANSAIKSYKDAKANGTLSKYLFVADSGWRKTYPEQAKKVDLWNASHKAQQNGDTIKKELFGYKYDSAFGLLIRKLIPENTGLRGFIFAALLGAVVSSLAAMLNAASTIFTIDIFGRFISRQASDRAQVLVGRICVILFAIVGCVVAPMLANPNLGGIFTFIQEFQGYMSPGILAVFIIGMFCGRTPRFAGALGILASPVIYGILQFFFNDIAFLNRIAITFGCCLGLMILLTLLKPNKREIEMPVNDKIDLSSPKSVKFAGAGVLAVSVALYVIFSGLFI